MLISRAITIHCMCVVYADRLNIYLKYEKHILCKDPKFGKKTRQFCSQVGDMTKTMAIQNMDMTQKAS